MYKRILGVFTFMLIITGMVFCQQPVPDTSNTATLKAHDHLIPSKLMENPEESTVNNIILLIGDGMGLTQISSAFYFKESLPHYSRFNSIGLMKTSSTTRITDSAAGATAFSAGAKTYNGAIGVNSDTIAVPTIIEILSKEQWKTGLVATSSITHATPASFYAHVKSRNMAEDIAAQLCTSEVDIFAGGGLVYFEDSTRSDGVDYLSTLRNNGFTVKTEQLETEIDPNRKFAYLLGQDALPTVLLGRGDFLPNATEVALDYLSMENDHFFLMVEGSMIDWGGHANDADFLVSEMIDFDDAIGIALDFAEKDGNTLVIVTADHETGGFTLGSGANYNEIKPTFSTGGHSTTLIPVAAFGPGAELFQGIYENTEIFYRMMQAVTPLETTN